jgi:hypothetical protein
LARCGPAPAAAGADAVVSALGPRSYREASSITSAGTASILEAMRAAGTSRVVVISAAPVATDDHGTTLPYRLLVRPMLRALLRRSYVDMAIMEEETRRSGPEWTILRPPRLIDGPPDRDLAPGQGRQPAPRLPHFQGRPGDVLAVVHVDAATALFDLLADRLRDYANGWATAQRPSVAPHVMPSNHACPAVLAPRSTRSDRRADPASRRRHQTLRRRRMNSILGRNRCGGRRWSQPPSATGSTRQSSSDAPSPVTRL